MDIINTFKEVYRGIPDDIVEAMYIWSKNVNNPPANNIPSQNIKKVKNVKEVIKAIKEAINNGSKIRVLGSEHSAPESILSDPFTEDYSMLLLVDELRSFECVDEDEGKFRVGAGLHIGYNPNDRAKDEKSDLNHSFAKRVDDKKYALSILGGITQQTIGGFLLTGSAGGSLDHTFADHITVIEYVDGKGVFNKVEKPNGKGKDSREWHALGVSMGLLGVITHVTFQLQNTYKVKGTEVSEKFEESSLRPVGERKYQLEDSLKGNEYYRALWYPQTTPSGTVVTWKGKQCSTLEDDKDYENNLSKPFMQIVAASSLLFLDDILCKDRTNFQTVSDIIKLETYVNQEFVGKWFEIIPSDEDIPVDSLVKIVFTEMWFPVKKSNEVMSILEDLFKKDKKACWNTPIEIYGAKQSPFWLSPSFKGDMVRVDGFWYYHNAGGDVRRDFYFKKFWEALINVEGIAFHWGKHVPKVMALALFL